MPESFTALKMTNDNWLGTSTLGWGDFQLLSFMADGQLYGVNNDKFYKRSPPTRGSDSWLGSSTMIGSGGWSVFKFMMGPMSHKWGAVVMATVWFSYVETVLSQGRIIPD